MGNHSTFEKRAKELKKNYTILPKVLGGQGGKKVFLVKNKNDPEMILAVKIFSKKKLECDPTLVKDRVNRLKEFKHPNVSRYFEGFESAENIYVLMEYSDRTSISEHIAKMASRGEQFSELDAMEIMEELLITLSECHQEGIIHGSLRPEKIRLGSKGQLKLIGFRVQYEPLDVDMNAGSDDFQLFFMPPEAFQNSPPPTAACDLWSAGIFMHVLLSGFVPFFGQSAEEVSKKIVERELAFTDKEWLGVSYEAKDLLARLLEKDPVKRITAQEALRHEWFPNRKNMGREGSQLEEGVIANLLTYRGQGTLKTLIMNVLIRQLHPKYISHLREQFKVLDIYNTGTVDINCLKKVLEQSMFELPEEELKQIVEEIDRSGDGKIVYEDFILATLSTKDFLNEEKLYSLFKQFDLQDNEGLDAESMVQAMKLAGHEVDDEETVKKLVSEYAGEDGLIDFDQFKQLFEESSGTSEFNFNEL